MKKQRKNGFHFDVLYWSPMDRTLYQFKSPTSCMRLRYLKPTNILVLALSEQIPCDICGLQGQRTNEALVVFILLYGLVFVCRHDKNHHLLSPSRYFNLDIINYYSNVMFMLCLLHLSALIYLIQCLCLFVPN